MRQNSFSSVLMMFIWRKHNSVTKSTEGLLFGSNKVGPEANPEKTEHSVMSREQSAG
jgi:predicted CDP-diglyceride synthetase/phosphatidate cytidylyltransferase